MQRSSVLVVAAVAFVLVGMRGLGQVPAGGAPVQGGRSWELGRPGVQAGEGDGIIGDRALVLYVQGLADGLARGAGARPVRVRLTRGGQEYAGLTAAGILSISSGMVGRLEDEAQLAGLIVHELAHGDGSCVLTFPERTSWPGGQRGGEIQANESAVSVLKTAGYDPEAFLILLSKLAYEHPELRAGLDPDDLLQLRAEIENEAAPRAGYRIDSSGFVRFRMGVMAQRGR